MVSSWTDTRRYTDGTGGCDGCLAWEGMGISFQKKDEPSGNGPYDKTFSDPGDITNGKGDNNGLAMTVLALEHVFKDSNLGDNGESLMTSGKSRADLWALAGMVAVEYSINENNLACTAATLPWTRKGAGASGCGRRDMDSLDCFIQMPRIPFRTGRTDCAPGAEPYIASKTEVHPSPFANGPMTLQWFETNFGLTNPKEVVALMGAHTLGKLDQRYLPDSHHSTMSTMDCKCLKYISSYLRNSFFKYFWNRGEHSYFNNQFYKNIVDENDVAIQCMKSATEGFIFIGMPNGTAGAVTYKAHGRGWFQGGGPFSWRRNLDLCYDGQIGKSGMTRMLKVFGSESEVNRNCYNPSTQLESGGPGWTCADACYTPDDFVDEVMLNSDMGLYLDFTVDQATGRQLGLGEDGTVSCPGLVDETRFSELWREGRRSGATIANCAKASTANLVESYANDQVNSVGMCFELPYLSRQHGCLILHQCLTRCWSMATTAPLWMWQSMAAVPGILRPWIRNQRRDPSLNVTPMPRARHHTRIFSHHIYKVLLHCHTCFQVTEILVTVDETAICRVENHQ